MHLETEKDNLMKELGDIAIPKSATRGILLSFIAIILGVIIPLMIVVTDNVSQLSIMFGFSGFMSSLMVMFYYFGFELRSEIEKSNIQKRKITIFQKL